MFPSLQSTEAQDATVPRPVAVPPPHYFRPLSGSPRNVRLALQSWTAARHGLTVAQRAGLRYEDRAQQRLKEWNAAYLPSPRIDFEDDNGARFVVPDGLLSAAGRVTIFEIKSQHMPEAWWQLEQLYRPVLQARRPGYPISCVEVCRSYDPAMPFPAAFDTLQLADLKNYSGHLGVLVLP